MSMRGKSSPAKVQEGLLAAPFTDLTSLDANIRREENALTKEVLNMHFLWLRQISDIITVYMNAYIDKDIERQLDMLHLLETITSPKIDNDDVEKKLKWLDDNLEKAFIRNSEGDIIRWRPGLVKQIKKNMIDTFRILLIKLEAKGILTFEPKEAGRAMGKFSSA